MDEEKRKETDALMFKAWEKHDERRRERRSILAERCREEALKGAMQKNDWPYNNWA